jgi:hypothetical protein
MSSTVRHVGLADPLVGFPVLERRSLAVNTANRQLAVGDEAPGLGAGAPLELIAIRYFATTAQYVAGDFAVFNGQIWKAKDTIDPGPFDPSAWVGMTDGGQFVLLDGSREMYGNLEIDKPGASLVLNAIGASQADIWFRRDGLTRWLFRSDDLAAVDFHIYRFDEAGFVIDAPLVISRSTGRVSILTNPTLPLELVPKQYVDALHAIAVTRADDRVLRAGDTMTGGLVVPVLTIKNAGYSDLYFAEGDGVARWLIRGNDPTTTNLEFHHYNAGGGYAGAALVLDNVTGDATFQGVIKTTPGLQFGGSAPSGFYGDGTNIAIRTYGNNTIYFQNAAGTLTYARMFYGGMEVDGVITSTAQDGLRVTVPAGYFARTLYTVSGVRQWSAGAYADGRYAIGDESAGRADMIIDTNGDTWFYGNVNVKGLFAVSVNAGTGNFETVNTTTLNTGTLNVSGNGDIQGNLVVHGTISSSGTTPGGTPIPTSASGYQTRYGTPGPFVTGPVGFWNYPGAKYFNIADGPPSFAGYWGLWVDHLFAGSFAYMGSLFTNRVEPLDAWEGVKAAPVVDYEDPAMRDGVEREPLMSAKTIAALMKALQQAMTRIEALEARLEEMHHAGSR